MRNCSSASPLWSDAPDGRGGRGRTADHSLAFRQDTNMWQQQQVSDFAEKRVIFFWYFFGFCLRCVFLCMIECVKCSVAYSHVDVLIVCWIAGGVGVYLVVCVSLVVAALSGPALHWLLQTHFATSWYDGEPVVHVVADQVTHTFKPMIFSTNLKDRTNFG